MQVGATAEHNRPMRAFLVLLLVQAYSTEVVKSLSLRDIPFLLEMLADHG